MTKNLKSTFYLWIIASILTSTVLISPVYAQTNCPDLGSTFGSANYTLSNVASGSHRVWLRLNSPDGTASVKYSVSGGGVQCNQTVSVAGATNWKWVQSTAQFTTTGGNASLQLAGTKAGVGVDCFVLTTDASFSPATAADCKGPQTPVTTLPDVIVVPGSVTVTPANPVAGQEVQLSAVIKNTGTVATPNNVIHGVAFVINGENVAWSDNTTASLAPGATRTVTSNGGPDGNGTWKASQGIIPVTVNWDDVGRIAETNETNNSITSNITVAASPTTPVDVTPPSSTINTSPSGVVNTGTLTINVVATDNVAISRVALEIVGGAEIASDNISPYNLTVDTRTKTLLNGNYQLQAVSYDTSGNRTVSSPVLVKVRLTDIDRSGTADIGDLTAIISSWNQSNPAIATKAANDLDDDGVVGIGDLTKLISAWGR